MARSDICESRVGAQGCLHDDLIETQPIDKRGSEGIDVFNATGTGKLGAYYPGAGFVPKGESPTCVSVAPTTVIKRKK